ncbi:MAG: VCBS domain-containing protein [Pseudomonadota bacterium]
MSNLIETNFVLTTNGNLTISDVDSATTFVAGTLVGTNGSLTIDATGAWIYTANSAHDEFAAGSVHTDIFTVTSTDGGSRTVTVNITGTDDKAVLSASTVVNLVETDSVLTTNGNLTISDVDSATTFVAGTLVGTNGSLTIDATGAWIYTANSAHDEFVAGSVHTDIFTVTSTDGGSRTVTVNITGTDDKAVLSASTVVNLVETDSVLTTNGNLTISDVDSATTFVAGTLVGTNGSLTIDATGAWIYTANSAHDEFVAGSVHTDIFTVTSTDGGSRTVTVNITGTDDKAVLSASTVVNLVETDSVLTTNGNLTISDVDSATTFVAGTLVGTNGSLTIDATGAWIYTANSAHDEFAAGTVHTDIFTVTSTDGGSTTVTVNITGTDDKAVISTGVVANLTETNSVLTTNGNLSLNDIDGTTTFVGGTLVGTNGSLTIDATGAWIYTANSAHDEFAAGSIHTDIFTVTSTDGGSTTVTVNITGTDDKAVLSASTVSNLIETDSVLTTNGNLSINDVDGTTTFVAGTLVATNGSLSIDATGAWIYTANSAHDEFAAGSVHTDVFTVTSTDGGSRTVTVNISGTDDKAVLSASTVSNLVETDSVLTTNGNLSISDVDSATTFNVDTVIGIHGVLSINAAGAWVYTANSTHNEFAAGSVHTDVFTVTSTDGGSRTVTVNITGTDDKAVLSASTVTNLIETDSVLTTNGNLTISDVDSATTFVAGTLVGTNGSLSIDATGAWIYTANSAHDEFAAGSVHTDVFTVTSTDGGSRTVTVNITGTDDKAVLSASTVVDLTETNAVLTTNGNLSISDVDSTTTFIPATIVGANGSLTVDAAGAWLYTANSTHDDFVAGSIHSDIFTVTANDGTTTTVTIKINGTDDLPVATVDSTTLTETNAILSTTGNLSISDLDNASVAFNAATLTGSYGDLSITAAGAWTFTASAAHDEFVAGTTYTDVFTVTANDGTSTTVTIKINGTNDLPVVTADSVTLTETNAVLSTTGNLSIVDADNAGVAFTPATIAGTYGTLVVDATGAWTFTASTAHNEFVGGSTYTDVFTVTANDGTATAVTINILGSNDPSMIHPQFADLVETNAILSTTGQLSISDPDNPSVAFIAATLTGTYGNLSINAAGAWTFTANSAHNEFVANTYYSSTFNIRANDGNSTFVSVTIKGTDDLPVITSDSVTLTETNAILTTTGNLSISDLDNASIAFNAATLTGSYGDLSITAAGAWTFTASTAHNEFVAGSTYTDVFTVTANDGTSSTVTIKINGTNDLPVVTADSVTLTETNAVLSTTGNLSIVDADNAGVAFTPATIAGTYGTLVVDATGAWTFTASTAHNEFVGGSTYTDVFTVTANDGTATAVTINILGSNDPSMIHPQFADLVETNAILSTTGQLSISDPDNPSVAFIAATLTGTYGNLSINAAGAWTFTANSAHNEFVANTYYSSTFNIRANDGNSTFVSVTIKGTDDLPVITSDSVTLTETNAILTTTGNLSISDLDNASIAFNAATLTGSYGDLSITAAGAWTFTASTAHNEFVAGSTYTDVFTVTANDGTTSTVTIKINGTNDLPVVTAGSVTLTETNAILSTAGNLTISDADNAGIAFNAATLTGSYGNLSITTAGAWTFTASTAHNEFVAGTTYTDVFTVTANDGTTTTVTIKINGTNDMPVVTADSATLTETNAILSTTGNLTISDADNASIAFNAATLTGAYGNLSITAGGAWTFTASTAHNEFVAGTTYTDIFTVTANDGTTTTVTIKINGTDDIGVISADVVNLVETNAVLTANGTLVINDPDTVTNFVAANLTGTHGNLSINTAGVWTYTANSAHNEFSAGIIYSETFTVATSNGGTSTVVINIAGTNDAPLAKDDTNTVTEDAASTTLTVTAVNGLIQSTSVVGGKDTDAESNAMTITGVRTGAEAASGTAGTTGAALTGAYGALTLNADGSYSYVLRNTSAEVQNLMAGETAYDVFTYTISDGKGGTDQAVLTIAVHGSMDLTAAPATLTALPNAANGLTGAYYGYNDTVTSSGRTHSDDGTATFGIHGVAGNLNSVEDVYAILDGRNASAGGASIVGTADSAVSGSADVTFLARTLSYGVNVTVSNALGANSAIAAGGTLPAVNSGSSTQDLTNFLDQDKSTALVQTGANNSNGTSGLGNTSDAAVRLSGQIYVQPGYYDFRVTADDGFRLKVAGQTLLEFDGNQAPTTRIFSNVLLTNLEGGMQDIELVYWEQGGNAILKIEFKQSNDPAASYQVLSLMNTALFSAEAAPTLADPQIQDLVYDTTNATWQMRTGSRLDGDASGNTLTGGDGRDLLSGNDGNDTLNGNGGADRIDGGSGDDTLSGGTGNDVLIGGAGTDKLTGGAGDDIFVLSDSLDDLNESNNGGMDTIQLDASFGGASYTLIKNFENLTALGSSNISLTGYSTDNRIEGNSGNNVIDGAAGNDYLIGGAGNDTLTGGSGADVFAWRLADKGSAATPAADTITDFTYGGGNSNIESGTLGVATGGGDVLDLRDLLQGEHTSLGLTNPALSGVEISDLTNYIHVEISGSNTILHINSSGGFSGASNSGEDQTITLTGVNLYSATSITSGDDANLLRMLIKMGTLRVD